MSKELDEKWLELVKAGKAEWMPGMLACIYRDDGSLMGSNRHGKPGPGFFPDWTDPATLGCLLAMVREAWGDSYIYFGSSLSTKRKRWSWVMGGGDCIGQGDTEAEALLAALEAAP
jgi:hypothetical protein